MRGGGVQEFGEEGSEGDKEALKRSPERNILLKRLFYRCRWNFVVIVYFSTEGQGTFFPKVKRLDLW